MLGELLASPLKYTRNRSRSPLQRSNPTPNATTADHWIAREMRNSSFFYFFHLKHRLPASSDLGRADSFFDQIFTFPKLRKAGADCSNIYSPLILPMTQRPYKTQARLIFEPVFGELYEDHPRYPVQHSQPIYMIPASGVVAQNKSARMSQLNRCRCD